MTKRPPRTIPTQLSAGSLCSVTAGGDYLTVKFPPETASHKA